MSELTDIVDFIAPGFASDPARRNAAISMATRFVGATSAKWGAVYQDAIANLAAHFLTIYDPRSAAGAGGAGGSVAGAITSIKTGRLAGHIWVWRIVFGRVRWRDV